MPPTYKTLLMILKIHKLLLSCLFLIISTSTNADCVVGEAPYDVRGRAGSGVIAIDRGNPLTLVVLAGRSDNNTDDLTTCDVSEFTSMNSAFKDNATFNQDISSWDTSSVEDMDEMFRNANSFDQDVGNWDTGAVKSMSGMFYEATSFNGNIGNWDISNVTKMKAMFYEATAFNSDIGNWDTSNVKNMEAVFRRATAFDQNIGSWDTSKVENMTRMFLISSSFNRDIGSWDTSNVTTMNVMFGSASQFDQDIGNWDTSNVTTMEKMFKNAITFNQDITNWDTNNVAVRSNMFLGATQMLAAGYDSNGTFAADVRLPIINSVILNAANSALTVTFSENVYNATGSAGNLEVADFALTLTNGTAILGSNTPISITKNSQRVWVLGFETSGEADGGEAITVVPAGSTSIYDAAGNAASTTQSGNTASLNEKTAPTFAAFEAVKADIENNMASNARTQLNDFSTSMSAIVSSARSRFMNKSGVADSSDTALSGDVSTGPSDLKGSTKRVTTKDDGKAVSIFEAQYQYTKTKEGLKSQNASGQIVLEKKLADAFTFGRFLGTTLGDANAVGMNNISIEFMGAQAGAYLIANTKSGLVVDTYVAVSVIENKMGITTSVMTADSKYYSSMLTTGASVTGSIQTKHFEIRPNLSADLSYMFRKTVDFHVTVATATSIEQAAYGDITKVQISFAPEFRFPFTFGGSFWEETVGRQWDENAVLTATPNVKCRYLKQSTAIQDCGQGLSLGFRANSKGGVSNLNAQFQYDKVGSTTSRSVQFGFKHRF